jgi:hypothetical protein
LYKIKTAKLHENTRGGGTVAFGRKEINTKVLKTPFVEGIIKSTEIALGNMYLINIYRPPSSNKDDFIILLVNLLDTLRGKNIILTGNFNINFMCNNNTMKNISTLYNLKARIKDVTKIASATCINIIYYKYSRNLLSK